MGAIDIVDQSEMMKGFVGKVNDRDSDGKIQGIGEVITYVI